MVKRRRWGQRQRA